MPPIEADRRLEYFRARQNCRVFSSHYPHVQVPLGTTQDGDEQPSEAYLPQGWVETPEEIWLAVKRSINVFLTGQLRIARLINHQITSPLVADLMIAGFNLTKTKEENRRELLNRNMPGIVSDALAIVGCWLAEAEEPGSAAYMDALCREIRHAAGQADSGYGVMLDALRLALADGGQDELLAAFLGMKADDDDESELDFYQDLNVFRRERLRGERLLGKFLRTVRRPESYRGLLELLITTADRSFAAAGDEEPAEFSEFTSAAGRLSFTASALQRAIACGRAYSPDFLLAARSSLEIRLSQVKRAAEALASKLPQPDLEPPPPDDPFLSLPLAFASSQAVLSCRSMDLHKKRIIKNYRDTGLFQLYRKTVPVAELRIILESDDRDREKKAKTRKLDTIIVAVDTSSSTMAEIGVGELNRLVDHIAIAAIALAEWFRRLNDERIETPDLRILNFSKRTLVGDLSQRTGELLAVHSQSEGTYFDLEALNRLKRGPTALVLFSDGAIENYQQLASHILSDEELYLHYFEIGANSLSAFGKLLPDRNGKIYKHQAPTVGAAALFDGMKEVCATIYGIGDQDSARPREAMTSQVHFGG